MSLSFVKRLDKIGLTRISVTGGGGVFQVRIGSGDSLDAACVRMERDGLRCDCGRRSCRHIESLAACGFLDEATWASDRAEAA